jgi:branched-chain amino acid transport system substrate-binding protein
MRKTLWRIACAAAATVALSCLIAATPAWGVPGVDAKNKTIKIALVGPLTGQYGVYGTEQKAGADIAMEMFNSAGGFKKGPYAGYKLAGEYFDDKGDPKESANVAQQVVVGNYFAEVGPTNSSPASASAPIYNRANVPMILVYASDTRLTHSGYKNVFRIVCTTDTEGYSYAIHMAKELKAKKVVEVWENTAYGQGVHNAFIKTCKDNGVEVAASETFVVGQDVDFKPILTKMRELKPDVLMLNVTYNEGGMLVSQARAMGWDVPMLGAIGCNAPKFLEMMPQNPGTVYLSPVFNQLSADPTIVAFIKAYRAKHNQVPSESAALAYDAVNSVIAAVEVGATKREQLKDFLHKVDFKGVTNQIRFDENGDVKQPSLPLWKLQADKTWATYQ